MMPAAPIEGQVGALRAARVSLAFPRTPNGNGGSGSRRSCPKALHAARRGTALAEPGLPPPPHDHLAELAYKHADEVVKARAAHTRTEAAWAGDSPRPAKLSGNRLLRGG